MFKNVPKILAHSSSVSNGNFVTPEYILSNDGSSLFTRYCPHRRFPIGNTGSVLQKSILCNFHGYEWDLSGAPVNNNRRINCGKYIKGASGLLFTDFIEPNHHWVSDLKSEQNLQFSHVREGSSNGSWLWMMEVETDLCHIRKGKDSVHPELGEITDVDAIALEQGDDWVIQSFSTGWWLFIFPFSFVEYSKGCLSINYTIPNDINNEFGFNWHTQYYFDPSITDEQRTEFEFYIDHVFRQDVGAIEKQKGPYYPLVKASNRLEEQCVHFGNWVKKHREF